MIDQTADAGLIGADVDGNCFWIVRFLLFLT